MIIIEIGMEIILRLIDWFFGFIEMFDSLGLDKALESLLGLNLLALVWGLPLGVWLLIGLVIGGLCLAKAYRKLCDFPRDAGYLGMLVFFWPVIMLVELGCILFLGSDLDGVLCNRNPNNLIYRVFRFPGRLFKWTLGI